MNVLEKINKCIEQMKTMSQEEFETIILEKKINDITYDVNDYVGGGFTVKLPSEIASDKESKSSNKDTCKIEKYNPNVIYNYSNQDFNTINKYYQKIMHSYENELKIKIKNSIDCWKSINHIETYTADLFKSDNYYKKILECQQEVSQSKVSTTLILENDKYDKDYDFIGAA